MVTTAYVGLCIGDYLTALTYSKELLAQEKLSGLHMLLGHLYAAECLVLSNNVTEALTHLNPELITDISSCLDITSGEEALVQTSPPLSKLTYLPNKEFKLSGTDFRLVSQ